MKNNKKLSLAKLIYTALGLGLIPKAPGTFGTLMGVLIYFFIYKLNFYFILTIYALVFIIGFWATKKAEQFLAEHDNQTIVIDEVIGYLTTVLLAPVVMPYTLILAFVFFRFFDILKPWPVSFFDKKVDGAWGVILDDVAAGLYSLICLWICYFIFKGLIN